MVVGDSVSSWKTVLSGVPQGSVLGPLLFVLFINDLLERIRNFCKLFADDSKIIAIIKNIHDQSYLQDDLDKLMRWTIEWRMGFNLSKCQVMHFGNVKIHQDRHYMFHIESEDHIFIMNNTNAERGLGVIIDDRLRWDRHIKSIILRANTTIGRLRKIFTNWEPRKFRILYLSYVRPILEYGWWASKKKYIK